MGGSAWTGLADWRRFDRHPFQPETWMPHAGLTGPYNTVEVRWRPAPETCKALYRRSIPLAASRWLVGA
jgi:hypothetical protein